MAQQPISRFALSATADAFDRTKYASELTRLAGQIHDGDGRIMPSNARAPHSRCHLPHSVLQGQRILEAVDSQCIEDAFRPRVMHVAQVHPSVGIQPGDSITMEVGSPHPTCTNQVRDAVISHMEQLPRRRLQELANVVEKALLHHRGFQESAQAHTGFTEIGHRVLLFHHFADPLGARKLHHATPALHMVTGLQDLQLPAQIVEAAHRPPLPRHRE